VSDEGWPAPSNRRAAIVASEQDEDKRSGTRLWLRMGEYCRVQRLIWLSAESVGIEKMELRGRWYVSKRCGYAMTGKR
jgi:hypothetical protein